jgi:hypothetical protein
MPGDGLFLDTINQSPRGIESTRMFIPHKRVSMCNNNLECVIPGIIPLKSSQMTHIGA